jgi:hypothetical protein
MAVPRSSGRREVLRTPLESKSQAATASCTVSMPFMASVCERTAERPANSASSKASTVRPMGVTKPMPLTRTGAEAARAAEAASTA